MSGEERWKAKAGKGAWRNNNSTRQLQLCQNPHYLLSKEDFSHLIRTHDLKYIGCTPLKKGVYLNYTYNHTVVNWTFFIYRYWDHKLLFYSVVKDNRGHWEDLTFDFSVKGKMRAWAFWLEEALLLLNFRNTKHNVEIKLAHSWTAVIQGCNRKISQW